MAGRARIHLALWRMARPAQIALIALVYALGVAMAYAHGAAATTGSIAFGLLALLPVAASVHYANEYVDVETDALTDRTPFSGGSGALADTGFSPRLALLASVVSGALAVGLVGLGTVSLGGRPLATVPAVLLVGVLVVGWQYSLGPLRLAWNGLGEVTNAVLGGIVLPLYGFAVVTEGITVDATLATVPFALVVFVNLLETQWPDRRADAAVGKRTLATRWSPGRLRLAYGIASTAAVVATLVLVGRVLPVVVAVATLVPMAGLAIGMVRFTRREKPFPAVVTMVLVAFTTTVGWLLVAEPALVEPGGSLPI